MIIKKHPAIGIQSKLLQRCHKIRSGHLLNDKGLANDSQRSFLKTYRKASPFQKSNSIIYLLWSLQSWLDRAARKYKFGKCMLPAKDNILGPSIIQDQQTRSGIPFDLSKSSSDQFFIYSSLFFIIFRCEPISKEYYILFSFLDGCFLPDHCQPFFYSAVQGKPILLERGGPLCCQLVPMVLSYLSSATPSCSLPGFQGQ